MIESSWFKGLERVALTRQGGTGQTRPGESVAGAGRWGITGPRAGVVIDAHGASCAVWRDSCAGPHRNKPGQRENGETTPGAVDRGQSERTTGNRREFTGRSPAPRELPEAAVQGSLVRTYSCRWPAWLRGREQSHQEPLGSCTDSRIRIILFHPSAHEGCGRLGDRTALADGFCF